MMSRILVVAGAASSLVNFRGPLLEAMLAAGHTVHAAAPAADVMTLAWMKQRSIHFHAIKMERAGLSILADLATFRDLLALMRRLQPDAVLAYTIKSVVYGMLAALSAGVAKRFALVTGLGFAFTAGDGSSKRRIARLIARPLYWVAMRCASLAFFQNPDDVADFRKRHLLPAHLPVVIVNGSGVSLQQFPHQPLPDAARFLMIARLVADKGVGEFIAAARIVKASNPDVMFDLVGPTDPNPSAIRLSLVEDAAKQGILAYHGEQRDVRPYLAACSVFVLPSYREGTPRTVLEAMATGRAIITTDAPGCRETVVLGCNGLMVPVRDSQALAAAILVLANDPELRSAMAAQSLQIAKTKYDAGLVNQHMLTSMALTDQTSSVNNCISSANV